MIKAGIVDGSGHRAGELIRLLIHHPDVQLMWVTNPANPGASIAAHHRGLVGETALTFSDAPDLKSVDVVFLCHAEGSTPRWLERHQIPEDLRIIDMSTSEVDEEGTFVYGLTEYNRKPLVRGARRAVTPGALAMALELSLLPLATHLMLNSDVHVTAISASSEAAMNHSEDTHARRSDNVFPSALLAHDDVPEVEKLLSSIQNSFDDKLHLIELSGPFARGLMTVTYLDCPIAVDELVKIYQDYYDDHNFTYLSPQMPELKDVINTNKCLLHLSKSGNRLVIVAVIDNLLKGAAGNAVHLMNLLFGLAERTGLNLKASAY